jgi:hypothetical protein
MRLSRSISSQSLYATASIDQLMQLFPIGKATDPSPDPGRLVVSRFSDPIDRRRGYADPIPIVAASACPEVHAAHQ